MVTSIRGTSIPTSSECDYKIADFVKNADYTASGLLTVDRVRTRIQIDISYKFISAADNAALLALFASNLAYFFTVVYTHPQTNAVATGTFYVSDRDLGVQDKLNGVTRYKDLKFTLVER